MDTSAHPHSRPINSSVASSSVVVLGAGPTGLSCALELARTGVAVTVIEKQDEVGGHGRTHTIKGYDVDEGPHKLYPQVPCAKSLIDHFVGSDLLVLPKTSQVYIGGKYMNYPFGIVDLFKTLGLVTGLRCGISFGFGRIRTLLRDQDRTYTDFVQRHFGSYTHELVFRSVAEKLWGDPDQLDVQLAKTRIIAPNILELLKGLLWGFKGKPNLSADAFYYPRNGLRQLWQAIEKEIAAEGGAVMNNAIPLSIERADDGTFLIDYTHNGTASRIHAESLISTIPMKTALNLFRPPIPEGVGAALNALELRSLYILYIVVNVPRLLNVNWIFVPESKYHFARISEQKGFSESMIPPDRTVLMVEIPAARAIIQQKVKNRDALREEIIGQLREIGVLKSHHTILDSFYGYSDSIYPVYDLGYRNNLQNVLDYTDSIPRFYLNGRLGLFCYNNMDHSMEMGTLLARHIIERRPVHDWQEVRKIFYEYKIVD